MGNGIVSRVAVAAIASAGMLAGVVGTSAAQPASEQQICSAYSAGDAYGVICNDYLRPESGGRFSGETWVQYRAPGSRPQIEVEGRTYDLPADGKRKTYLATVVRNRVCTADGSRCSAWKTVPKPS